MVDSVGSVCENCATQAVSREAIPPAAGDLPEISGYRLLSQLGEGGMGTVYLAEETALGRRVAIKIIGRRVVDDARSKTRFAREARTLATIEHPNVVRVYSYGEAGGQPYLAMEFVEGETLGDRLGRDGSMSVDETLRMLRQIVEALEAAWEQHVVHRDIKPSNVLIDRRGRVRVADFGLAKPIDVRSDSPEHSLTEAGLVVGTPHYLAPEQAQGLPTDHRSDIYSLGLLFYQMLTGKRPFDASSPFEIIAKQLREQLPSVSNVRGDVPSGVVQLLESMTRKKPEERPQTHREILETIETLIGTTPGSNSMTQVNVKPASGHRLIGWWKSFAIIGATIAVVWAVSWFVVMGKKKGAPAVPQRPQSSFVVAVTPFYGPDDDSVKEGRVMAALVERAVGERLGAAVTVVGIEETKDPVRSDDQARALGEKLRASAVIWGEAFALRAETEIQPHVTVISRSEEAGSQDNATAGAGALSQSPEEAFGSRGSPTVKLQAAAPNQIELRKMSAAGIGDLVVLLAAIHQLEREKKPKSALALLRQLPQTTETMRYEVRALLEQHDNVAARERLEQITARDGSDVESLALLGELHAVDGAFDKAAEVFRRAEATGKPFKTSRAILFEGGLWLKETYRTIKTREERDTASIVVVDPTSGVVLKRFALPGAALALRLDHGSLEISYDPFRSAPPRTIRFRNGRPDEQLFMPVNYMWRLGLARSGSVIPANFINEVSGVRKYGESEGRFGLFGERHTGFPETLPALEQALRAAAQQDPTHPWHLLWLAVTLDHMGRRAEAEAVAADLARRDFPGIPYYVYGPMANQFERLKKHEWADAIWQRMAARRARVEQPVSFTTLLERLLNGAPRQAALNRDPERGYEVLRKSREISGLSFEGEDVAATLWARYFDAKGDPARAQHEREIAAGVLASPLSMTNSASRLKNAVTTMVAVAIGLLMFTVILIAVGVARARSLPRTARRTMWRQHPAWAVSLLTLAGGAVLIAAAYLLLVKETMLPVVIFAIAAGITATLRITRLSTRSILASIPTAARRTLFVAYGLLVATAILAVLQVRGVGAISAMPIGLADSQGHPWIRKEADDLLRAKPTDASRYLTAVVNHWGREWLRAEELYSALPEDHPGARANLAAVRARRLPTVMLTQQDVHDAYSAGAISSILPPVQVLSALGEFGLPVRTGPWAVAGYLAPVVLPLLLLIVLSFVPAAAGEALRHGAAWTAAEVLVPGLRYARLRKHVRAFATLLTLAFVATGAAVLGELAGSGGMLALMSGKVPDYFASAYPLPNGLHVSFGDRVALLFAPDGAVVWWAGFAVALAAFVVLHAATVLEIIREWRGRRLPAAPAPAAT
ncbi:MAG: serine/threonine-protein kinase [Thermoanaerobaculia bacterium]